MDAGQWKRIREIFDAAVEQPDREKQRRLVHSLCDQDAELIREVESLLETDARAEHFLEVPAAEAALFPAAAAPELPMKLGAYRLLEEAGRGGMADVYRAERADGQFSKQVAIKLLRGGIYGDDIRKRFHRERQVLAELNHPNIVRLWDGGVTDDGRPYLVEDFVEGPPVTEWAKGRNLDRESRLRLFLFVCDAVAYAHERGVIHRDIKPGNILTTNEGAPMLVDFGIAGLIEPGAAEPGGTQTLVRYWTPEYASPEQSRGEPAGRRSDVYSLGAVLYELLLERRPYRVDGLPPHEVTRIICEQEPDWNGLDRRLRAVVRKSLAKDTAARYTGARELASDLRRYLARQRTVAEQLPAPAKGRRVAMAAAAVLVLLLAAAGYRIWSQRTYTVKLEHVPGEQASPSLSPDGAEIAFQWTLDGQGGIGVMRVDGTNPRWLTRDQADCCVRWSPDGRTIGFLRESKRDRFELMVIRPDGSGVRRLTEIAGISMDWNRDSTQLAVAHRRHRDEPFAVFLVDVSTGRLRRLTSPPAGYYGDIAVAGVPSGGWVLARYQSPGNGVLMRCDEFGALQPLTTEPTWTIGPVVHPNEKEVLVRAAYSGRSGIWRVPLGGGEKKPIPSITGWDDFPSLSVPAPGRLPVLAVQFKPWDFNLWELRLDQPNAVPRPLIDSVSGEETPAYSRDGRRLVFRSDMNEGSQIWLADADGSRPVALTRLGGNDTRSPRLSPDGRTVAFAANADGRPYVYVAPVSGGTPRRLTADQVEEGVPVWSPDGNWIYFRSMRSGNFEIWRAAPDGTVKKRITHGGASQGLLSHDGASLYFVRNHDGGPLMRMPAGGGEAEKLPDGPFVRPESWAVGKDAIWFLDWQEARLMRYELETGRRTLVRQLGHPMFSVGVDIARDGSRIVWSQQDVRTARLAVVHNFR